MGDTRVSEVLAALSLCTDLASGMPIEKGLRVCLVADEFAHTLGLDEATRGALFQTTLLRSVGCTSYAPENAAHFVDDVAFQRALKHLDPGDPAVFAGQLATFGDWAPDVPGLAEHFAEIAPTVGPIAAATGCEVSRTLAPAFPVEAGVVDALDDVYERWDGLGIPTGRRAEEISLIGRIMHIAEQAVLALVAGGPDAALAEVRRRAGGHLDPELAAAFVAAGAAGLEPAESDDAFAAVLDREPGPWRSVGPDARWRMCRVLGIVADLKSVHLIGHSERVAAIAVAGARRAGLDSDSVAAVGTAASLHNLGCVVVPSSILDRAGALGTAAREQLRLHGYWTRRILERCPTLAHLEPWTRAAAAHHAAFAEGGYTTWTRPDVERTDFATRLLEAAEAMSSWSEPRPGRPALSWAQAADRLHGCVGSGLLDPDAVTAVLGGQPQPRRSGGLSEREIEVLRLTARGLTNREIAEALFLSPRTVGHHLAHVYDKTGLRTRAGVAVWAVEQGLLPE